MSYRAARLIVASGLALLGSTAVEAQTVVTPLFPGITHIKRTEQYPPFQCPGCAAPTPNPRLARMNILLVDLTSPAVRFKLTPPGENLPAVAPGSTTPNWPVVPFEVVRQRTLDFINTSHAQAAINAHFFAPFPVPGGSTQGAYAYVIGLAASRGTVYSGFESPIQSYAIVTNSPALNIDRSNNASIVHRHPDFADGMDVLEDVELWNALAGSGQILTNGVKTIPEYTDATHPDELLTPGPVPPLGPLPLTYTRAGRHWYDLSNARTAIGVTEDGRTLVLFTVDGTNGGHGMQVGEVADLLKRARCPGSSAGGALSVSTDRSGWLPRRKAAAVEQIRTVHASFRLTCPPEPWRSGRLTRNGERSPDPRERPARRGWRRRTGSRRRATRRRAIRPTPPAEAGHDRELRAGDRLHGQPAALPGHHHVFEAGGLLQRFERYYCRGTARRTPGRRCTRSASPRCWPHRSTCARVSRQRDPDNRRARSRARPVTPEGSAFDA